VARPVAIIPADLDLVVRVDVARIRRALGDSALSRLREQAAAGVSTHPALSRLLADALLRADTVWIALRPNARPELTDNVVVLRGSFAELDPRSYRLGFGPGADLGGGYFRHDRETQSRAEPARLYTRADELWILVSTAELDSVERQLEQRAGDPHLEPAEKGVLSFAARGGAVARALEDRSVQIARLLSASEEVRGHVDLDAESLDAEMELDVASEAAARDAADGLAHLAQVFGRLGPEAGTVVHALSIEAVGQQVVLRLKLPHALLAGVLVGAPD
jgi:hypothetical protein